MSNNDDPSFSGNIRLIRRTAKISLAVIHVELYEERKQGKQACPVKTETALLKIHQISLFTIFPIQNIISRKTEHKTNGRTD